jgi:hypothetical protein
VNCLNNLVYDAWIGQLDIVSFGSFEIGAGKLTVEVSPSWSSSPARIFLRIRLMILPLRVFGKSGTM